MPAILQGQVQAANVATRRVAGRISSGAGEGRPTTSPFEEGPQMTLPHWLDAPCDRRRLRASLLLGSLLLVLPLAAPCRSTQRAEAAEPGQIDIAYQPPKDAAHQPLRE